MNPKCILLLNFAPQADDMEGILTEIITFIYVILVIMILYPKKAQAL